MFTTARTPLEDTTSNAYSKLIESAHHVYLETRICAFNPFDAGWSDSFFKRVVDISSEIAKALEACSRPIENRIDMSQSVPFRLDANPCVEYYFAHGSMTLILIRYLFIFRYVPTAVAGGVLYRRDYVAVQNNIRGESNLPIGLKNLGSFFVVVDTWGTDFLPACTFDKFSPCEFFGIDELHRHSELHLGNYYTAVSKGRGNYVFFDNDLIDPMEYIHGVYYNIRVSERNEKTTEDSKDKDGKVIKTTKWTGKGSEVNFPMKQFIDKVGLTADITLYYDIQLTLAYGLTPPSDVNRWWYCQRFQTTLDKDSLDGSDSGAAVERSTHWYAFNDGRIYSPSDLEPIAETCARDFDKPSIFDGKKAEEVRKLVIDMITCPDSGETYESFAYSQDGKTYTADTVGVPCDVVIGSHNWHVLDYDDTNPGFRDQFAKGYDRFDASEVDILRVLTFSDTLTVTFKASMPQNVATTATAETTIVYDTNSIINTIGSMSSDSGRIRFSNFKIIGGLNMWTSKENGTYRPSMKYTFSYKKASPETHGNFSVNIGAESLTFDGVVLPIKEGLFAAKAAKGVEELDFSMFQALNDVVWPCSVSARTLMDRLVPYWLVRLPYSTISTDLKRSANFKLSNIKNAHSVNSNYPQSLIRIKPKDALLIVRKDK